MIQKNIDHIGVRLAAFEDALITALPTRHIKRAELIPFHEHKAQEIRDGVVTIISSGESNYNNSQGMVAREGTLRLILVGHLKLDENATGLEIETAEIALIEEIKAFVRAGVPGMSLSLDSSQQSRQLDKPYGWTLQYLDVGPLKPTTS
jgi:hypothetical protein